MTKIDIRKIFEKHIETLRDTGSGTTSKFDVCIFYAIPAGISLALLFMKYRLGDGIIGVLLAAFAILTGFLFNLLVVLYDMIERLHDINTSSLDTNNQLKHQTKKIVLEETFHNISYAVIVGLLIVSLLVLGLVSCNYVNIFASFMVYFLALNFMLTLLMILKRFNYLISREFDPKN